MIRLGHIVYSNCFPVHARLLAEEPPADVEIVTGVPSELNRRLAAGTIDVAPCSSIEYARHAGEYVLLADLAIASDGAVGSILLESAVAPSELGGREVAVPTASATSVVLLRALLELRLGIEPVLRSWDQGSDPDPVAAGAAAALRIGDIALARAVPDGRHVLDLGAAWREWTGLPFVFAVWQTTRAGADPEVIRLHERLLDSRAWFHTHAAELAQTHATTFDLPAGRLATYWQSLRYTLGDREKRGLVRFYEMAARLGEAPAAPALRFLDSRPSAAAG